MHISRNPHKGGNNDDKDIINLIENNALPKQEQDLLSKTTSNRRKSMLQGCPNNHKWYDGGINGDFATAEINRELRSRKGDKSAGVCFVPAGTFNIYRQNGRR